MLIFNKGSNGEKTNNPEIAHNSPRKNQTISGKISDKLLGTLLNTKKVRETIQGITEKKNKLAADRSPENLQKLISDEERRLKCEDHFRIYKKNKSSDTIVLDLTRNLQDFQTISKKQVLEILVEEVSNIVKLLKSNRELLGNFHKLELTSWIFGQRKKLGLRENITSKLANAIPELDKASSTLMKMTLVDKIGTMGVYPHDFMNVRHHQSKGKLVIDLDKFNPNIHSDQNNDKLSIAV